MKQLSLSAFADQVGDPAIAADVVAWIDRMPADPSLAEYVRKLHGVSLGAARYWDLACALNFLARNIDPQRYLEIGVRRGKSMAQIAGLQSDCDILGIDLWIHPYGGIDNPGPKFVQDQLKALGHRGRLDLISGDSNVVLLTLAATDPAESFDIITVDGDHSDQGAYNDLCAVAPLLNPGGYLLFDDLTHPAHTLGPVWDRYKRNYSTEFEFIENLRDHNGTGVARRLA